MRVWALAGLLALAGPPAPGQDVAATFAAVLPEAVIDVKGWEAVGGEFETPAARGTYLFYVNPRLQAIYQVMRYRVELLTPRPGLQERRRSVERVAFVTTPGAGEPMRCWERASEGSIPPWRELVARTDEYRLEMGVLMQVLAVHRRIRRAPAP